MESIPNGQAVQHTEYGHPRNLNGKHAQYVALTKPDGSEHTHRLPSLTDVSNRHDTDASNTDD